MEGPPAAQLGDPVNMGHGPQRTSRSHGMPRGAQMVRGALRSQPSSCARVPAAAQNREAGGFPHCLPWSVPAFPPNLPRAPWFFCPGVRGAPEGLAPRWEAFSSLPLLPPWGPSFSLSPPHGCSLYSKASASCRYQSRPLEGSKTPLFNSELGG